jgi:hypothetical protein
MRLASSLTTNVCFVTHLVIDAVVNNIMGIIDDWWYARHRCWRTHNLASF